MQEMDFFEGKRSLTKVLVVLHKGKRTITFTPWEEWLPIGETPFTLRCGNSRSSKVVRRFGMERTQRLSFENNIGSSLGVKGVAALESSLKTSLGEEIKFIAGTEQEEAHEFNSPECGYKVVKLFQRARVLHVDYRDTRFWHRDAKECTLVQWLAPIYDGSYAVKFDPSCGCGDERDPGPPGDGFAARLECGYAAKLVVQWQDNNQLEFGDKPVVLNSYFPSGLSEVGDLPTDALPDYLRFLAQMEPDTSIPARVIMEESRPAERDFRDVVEIEVQLDENFEPLGSPVEIQQHAEMFFASSSKREMESRT
jgi:hypothetical protein